MVALKYLVVCIANHFQVIINKSLVNGNRYRRKLYVCVQICKNSMQPFKLFWIFGKQVDIIFLRLPLFKSLISKSNCRLKEGCSLV